MFKLQTLLETWIPENWFSKFYFQVPLDKYLNSPTDNLILDEAGSKALINQLRCYWFH
jgi:hypothetical protein